MNAFPQFDPSKESAEQFKQRADAYARTIHTRDHKDADTLEGDARADGMPDISADPQGYVDWCQREASDADGDRSPDEVAAELRRCREEAEIGEESGPDEAEGEPRVDRYLPAAPPPPTSPGAGGAGYGSCPAPGA